MAVNRSDLNGHCILLVLVGGEGLGLFGRDDAIAGNQLGHHPSNRLNAHAERAHIQQQYILDLDSGSGR